MPGWTATVPFQRGAAEIVDWFDADPARQQVDARMDALMDRLVERHRGDASGESRATVYEGTPKP